MPTTRPIALYIDDQLSWMEMMAQALRDDLDVRLCLDATTAVAAVGALKPDLILLDLSFNKGPGGEQILGRIMRTHPTMPIMIVSAFADLDRAKRCLAMGARDIVNKSLPTSVLLAQILEFAKTCRQQSFKDQDELARIRTTLMGCQRLPDLATTRRLVIDEALRRSQGNCSAAARLLGVTPQAVATFKRKLEKLGS